MKFENGLYICIYTLYMKFCDFVYIHVYIQHWALQNWDFPILIAEININCLSVYMIYTIFVYMMYIYTVYNFFTNLYKFIYTHVYENCIYSIHSVYIHAIYTLFVYIIYTYRHPRLVLCLSFQITFHYIYNSFSVGFISVAYHSVPLKLFVVAVVSDWMKRNRMKRNETK